MKKVCLFIISVLFLTLVYAQETESKTNSKNKIRVSTTMLIPIPAGVVSESYSIPLKFGDNPLFSMGSLSFSAQQTVSPISLDTQLSVRFSPIPFFTLSAGGSIGSGWSIADFSYLTVYNEKTDSFDKTDPFSAWKYALNAQASIMFDIGLFNPSKLPHIITSLNYGISYEGCTAADKNEIWGYLIGGENANGLKYSAGANMSYLLPWRFYMIGLGISFSGHFDGEDFGKYNANYNGNFTSISLSAQGMIRLGPKDSMIIMTSVPSRRKFVEAKGSGNRIKHTAIDGREWYFGGAFAVWSHSF